MPGDNIVLIGYRGSGKSTVGRLLADRLGWDFVDSDEAVCRRAGCTIRELFEAGEARFRVLETAALAELTYRRHVVVAAGGGAPVSEENQEILGRLGTVVWLKAEPPVLHARISADPHTADTRPPLTAAGGLEEVGRVLADRSAWYARLARITCDTSHREPPDIVEEILAALRLGGAEGSR